VASLGFHLPAGCDTVSEIHGGRKKILFDLNACHHGLFPAFGNLRDSPAI
jgi:hypothetical protein